MQDLILSLKTISVVVSNKLKPTGEEGGQPLLSHTCQPLLKIFLDIGDNFPGFSRALPTLYKYDILRTCSAMT